MPRLSKEQTRRHDAAVELLQLGERMTQDQREQIYQDWSPMAEHNVGKNAVFFTPNDLAHEAAMFLPDSGRVLDLCAGIGVLSWASLCRAGYYYRGDTCKLDITAVELNPAFVEIGRQLLPNVHWVNGSIFDKELLSKLGYFSTVISNPPFGQVPTKADGDWLSFHGPAHLMAVEVALRLAEDAVMILPQMDLPFKYSGKQGYEARPEERWSKNYAKIAKLLPSDLWQCQAIDCSTTEWQGAAPSVEVVRIGRDWSDGLYPAGLEAKLPLPEPRDPNETPEPEPQPPSEPVPLVDPNQMALF